MSYNRTNYAYGQGTKRYEPLSRSQQRKTIEKVLRKHGPPKVGEKWYAIESDWYHSFLNEESEEIRHVDNSILWDEERDCLKLDLTEKQHFELLPKDAYNYIQRWYKVAPVLSFVVKKDARNEPVIDLYPARFWVVVEETETDSEDGKDDKSTNVNTAAEITGQGDTKAETGDGEGEGEASKEPLAESADSPVDNKDTVVEDKGTEERNTDATKEASGEAGETERESEQKVSDPQPENVEEKKTKNQTRLLTMSRYNKMSKLKGKISRLLQTRPQQLTIYICLDDTGEHETYSKLTDLPEEELNRQIIEVLPNINSTVYKLKCIKQKMDENDLNPDEVFDRNNPQVGQLVDAKMNDSWLEARIIEVLYSDTPTDQKPPAESVVIEADNEQEGEEGTVLSGVKIKVHYCSFDSTRDALFDLESEDVDVAYTHTADWRQQLRKGTKVELNKRVFTKSNEWVEGEVVKIDRRAVTDLKTILANQIHALGKKKGEKGFVKRLMGFLSGGKPKKQKKIRRTDSLDSDSVPISFHGLVMVSIGSRQYHTPRKDYVVDLGSEDIAAEGTHIAKKKANAFNIMRSRDVQKQPKVHGVVGFRNLGNTCYMNSILQCLMQTNVIIEYFLSGEFNNDINRKNAIGHGGKVAFSFGKLAKQYFSDNYQVIAPSEFKRTFGGCCTTFAGTAQQDSQEFLTELLDALHEDLNKVKEKPSVEAPDSEGKTDHELAAISWENHLARNKSVFVDHMFGLLKSHLTCPIDGCGNEATKFDPYNNLVLPIPVTNEVIYTIIFVTLEPRLVRVIKDEKTGREYHEIVDEAESEDDEVYYTRNFRFLAMTKTGRIYGALCADDLAKKMGVEPENICLFTSQHYNLSKCVHTPLTDEYFFVRVNKRTTLFAFETREIDFPEQKQLSDEKYTKSLRQQNNDLQKKKPGKGPVKRVVRTEVLGETPVEKAPENTTEAKKENDKSSGDDSRDSQHPEKDTKDTKEGTEGVERDISSTKKEEVVEEKPTVEKEQDVEEDKPSEEKLSKEDDSAEAETGNREKELPIAVDKKETKEGDKENGDDGGKGKKNGKADKKKGKTDNKKASKEKKATKKGKGKTEGKKRKQEPTKEESVYTEHEFEDRFYLAKFKYKKNTLGYSKPTKHEDIFIWDLLGHTKKDIFHFAWSNMKLLFDLTEKLPPKGEDESPADFQIRETEVARSLIKVNYDKVEIVADSDDLVQFKYSRYHTIPYFTVSVKSPSSLRKGIRTEAPTLYTYGNPTLKDMDASLNVGFVAHTPSVAQYSTDKEVITLDHCFKTLSKPEKLVNEMDWWYCNKCKTHVPATKKMDVFTTSNILVIVLKRFSAGMYLRSKIDDLVAFPLHDLDVGDYVTGEESSLYDLYGVSYHMGGLGGGHYIARVRVEDKWYLMDDQTTRECKAEDVVNSKAYVLFYRKKTSEI